MIIGLGGFVLLKNNNAQEENSELKAGSPQVISVENQIINEKDTDNDGLKDWEETIWKTNPQKSDSDNDGESDADFVKRKEESIKNNNGNTENGSGFSFAEDGNKTGNLGKQLFSEYLALKQSGKVNANVINQMTERLAAEISESSPETLYFANDILTFPDSDKIRIKSYANTIALIRQKYYDMYGQKINDSSFLGVNDPAFIENLILAGELYHDMADELLKIPTPHGLKETHLKLLNNYGQSAQGLKKIELINEDPLISALGIKEHETATVNETEILQEMKIFISTNGIIFLNGEAGFAFWNSI